MNGLRPLAILAAALMAFAASVAAQDVTVIQGARVFTGDAVLETGTVVVRGATIESVAAGSAVQANADDGSIVDGEGMTLLPGLIDCHTHNFFLGPAQALNFGVTTNLDMLTAEPGAALWRRQQAAGPVPNRADVIAGGVVTVTGGHGTQFGVPVPTLDDPEQTEEFIAARVAAGAHFLKIIYEGGETVGRDIPTLAASTLPRIVAAGRAHDQLAVVHISTAERALEAIAAGVDGLVHIYHDRRGPPEVVAAAREHGIFVVPTLTVTETVAAVGGGAVLAADPRVAPFLGPGQADSLNADFGRERDGEMRRNILGSVADLYAAGVLILAGSDAPNPGTTQGASLHRELELLVEAGLGHLDALKGATSAAADAFGLDDRGRIEAGRKADLVLVRGDPLDDITATRDIEAIWKDGVRVERQRHQAAVE